MLSLHFTEEAYCQKRRVNDGKWWHHGPHSEETESSFQRRAVQLKKWLGQLQDDAPTAPLNVLLVTHGGIMQSAFGYQPHPPNCAFRVYDLWRSGVARHVARNEEVMSSDLLVEPVFQVLAVRRLSDKAERGSVFRVELFLSEEFYSELSETVLREELHDPIKEQLSPELYDAGQQFRKVFITSYRRVSFDTSVAAYAFVSKCVFMKGEIWPQRPLSKLVVMAESSTCRSLHLYSGGCCVDVERC